MDDRLPDRGDVLLKDGEQYTVIDLTKKAVRLLGNTGTVDVPIYRWPDGFAPLVPEQEPADAVPLRALLVGGDAGGHADRLEELALNLGVDIVAHWPGTLAKMPSKSLPVHVDLVIFLTSHMGHSLQNSVKPAVKRAGMPMALVRSNGFENDLRLELEKLGLRERVGAFSGEYQIPVATPADGRYVWTGRMWTWEEPEGPLLTGEPGSDGGGGEGFVAGVLSFLAVLGAVRKL